MSPLEDWIFLLIVDPAKSLTFTPRQKGKHKIHLKNGANTKTLAFKVKCTQATLVAVSPKCGFLHPKESTELVVSVSKSLMNRASDQVTEKVLIQIAEVKGSVEMPFPDVWASVNARKIVEKKIEIFVKTEENGQDEIDEGKEDITEEPFNLQPSKLPVQFHDGPRQNRGKNVDHFAWSSNGRIMPMNGASRRAKKIVWTSSDEEEEEKKPQTNGYQPRVQEISNKIPEKEAIEAMTIRKASSFQLESEESSDEDVIKIVKKSETNRENVGYKLTQKIEPEVDMSKKKAGRLEEKNLVRNVEPEIDSSDKSVRFSMNTNREWKTNVSKDHREMTGYNSTRYRNPEIDKSEKHERFDNDKSEEHRQMNGHKLNGNLKPEMESSEKSKRFENQELEISKSGDHIEPQILSDHQISLFQQVEKRLSMQEELIANMKRGKVDDGRLGLVENPINRIFSPWSIVGFAVAFFAGFAVRAIMRN